MNDKSAKIGDVFAYYLERYGVYCPCQVLFENEKSVAVVFFNHFSNKIPSIDIIKNSPILLKNHHSWKGEKFVFWVNKRYFHHFYFIENHPIIQAIDEKPIECDNFDQIDFQYAWQQLPPFIQENFKNKDPKALAKIFLKEPKPLAELQKIKEENVFAYEIESEFFDENLKQLLSENPIIKQLVVIKHADKVVDISNSKLSTFSINVSGVETIILNRTISQLFLRGDFSDLKEIVCPFDGRLLSLYLNVSDNFSAFLGLKQVRFLQVNFVKSLDIKELAKVVTHTPILFLASKGGTIDNILALKSFDKTESISLFDVFGFDEFPTKNELPILQDLSLWSIPKSIGEKMKKEFKAIEFLEIKQLRSEDWIKANVNNPLKDWDGRDGNSPAKAKKAMKAYANAYKKLKQKDPSKSEQIAIMQEFLNIFGQMDKKWQLDTVEREEVLAAYEKLLELTAIPPATADKWFEEIW